MIVWGAGELGGRVGKIWREEGGAVVGCTQTDRRHAELRAAGIQPQLGSPATLLQPDDALLLAIPGHTNQQAAVRQLAESGAPLPARVVFISVTGYHGDSGGPVTPESPPGEGSRSASIAAAEADFRQWAGDRGVVIRMGGLYCDGRGPFSALARRGKITRQAPPDKVMALMHYDDAAAATAAALAHPAPARVYLGVTVPCPTREEFYTAACAKLKLPPPQFDPPTGQPPILYDVSALRRDLLPAPAYPDWRMALVFSGD
ncbi:MAG: hypothetical protein Kow0031_06260 [Anaerolineae bacterium]